MSRPPVVVVPVDERNLKSFADLWREAKLEQGAPADVIARVTDDDRLVSVIRRSDVHCYLASVEERPVGLVAAVQSPFGLVEGPAVAIDQIYVTPTARRLGIARHLLGAVTTLAERLDCHCVVSHVPAQHREANRFFARLGFSSQVVRRATSTSALRRRLAGDMPRASLEVVLQRRRSLRARARTDVAS